MSRGYQGKYSGAPRRRKRRRNGGRGAIYATLGVLLLAMLALLLVHACQQRGNTPSETDGSQPPTASAEVTAGPTATTEPAPTEPQVVSTASVGVTGDILIHGPVMRAALASGGGSVYDFSSMFTYIQPYYESFDFMVANLEVTLGGTEAGAYQGYPTFNCPDSIASALQDAGVDLLLTANNHCYDTGHNGFLRTQQVLEELELPHLGTRSSQEDAFYTVQDINGIQVGMICYTYETEGSDASRKYLNGITLREEDGPLVCSFSYARLEEFYADVEEQLALMAQDGAEVTMVFLHWGDEYALTPNAYQQTIAQALCDLGVDVIVGGHPHVLEPFETLQSDSGQTTYCIYSTGNALSNQRRDTLTNGNAIYTEDGMIFGVEFQKWSDGRVEVSSVSILPTWVNKETKSGVTTYSIIPLDTAVAAWDGYDVGDTASLTASYNRTMSIVGQGLNQCRQTLGLAEVLLEIA